MKKKIVLTLSFIISLLPSLFVQYGGARGVQEISGFMNLTNPIGLISMILFAIGIYLLNRKPLGFILGLIGTIGIVCSEVFMFFTWHILTISGRLSFDYSLKMVYPEFYLGLIVSVLMIVVYILENKYIESQ